MIALHQFRLVNGINISPFCLKVETYLRLARLPYRVVDDLPFKGPKGKLPFIVDDDGRTIADSGDIIAYLEATGPRPLDADLSPQRRAIAHLVTRTMEESTYFAAVYDRWLIDANWPRLRAVMRADLPAALRWIVPILIRRKIRRDLLGQGYGRHTAPQVYARGAADIAAVAAALGDSPFLGGDQPASADASLYAFLVGLLDAGFDGPLTDAARAQPNLLAYHQRMAAHLAAIG